MPSPVAVVIPLKGLDRAKSRLDLPDQRRRALALALGLNSVRVALRTPEVAVVAVVTRDATIASCASRAGAYVVRERRFSNLNRAAHQGRRVVSELLPGAAIGILVGDLPDLTTQELSGAIAEFRTGTGPMVVTDWSTTGTSMLLHPPNKWPPVLFGPDSARRHAAAGYRAARGDLPGLRRDLDTLTVRDDPQQMLRELAVSEESRRALL